VLDTPGGALDKTHPARRPISVDDLMTHRSGLAYFFSVTGPLAKAYSRISARQNPDGWLSEVAALPLQHQPGDRLTYSNATDMLGILLERSEADRSGNTHRAGPGSTEHGQHRILRGAPKSRSHGHHVQAQTTTR
jgi:hypothetical protein